MFLAGTFIRMRSGKAARGAEAEKSVALVVSLWTSNEKWAKEGKGRAGPHSLGVVSSIGRLLGGEGSVPHIT